MRETQLSGTTSRFAWLLEVLWRAILPDMAKRFAEVRSSLKRKRPWVNISLRVMLLAAMLVGVWLAVVMTPVRRLQPSVADTSEEVRELERQLGDPSHDVREFAAERLGYLGPGASSAAASLLQAVGDVDLNVRIKAFWATLQISSRADLMTPSVYLNGVRLPAASVAEALGPAEAAVAVPLLLDLLATEPERDPERFERYGPATDALKHVALPAATVVPALIERLSHELPKVRIAAAEQLLRLGTAAKEAVPVLKARLHDRDPACAAACAAALGAIDASDDESLAVLKASLHCDDFAVRLRVLEYLWMLGPVAAEASDDLVSCLCDLQRMMVFPYYDLNAVKRIGPPAVASLDRALKQAVADQESLLPAPKEHRQWLRSLGITAATRLQSALCAPEHGRQRHADSSDGDPLLARIRSMKARFLQWGLKVTRLWATPDPRHMIPAWLLTLGPPAAPAVPTLIAVVKVFQYQDYWPQYFAIRALGSIGKDAAPAVAHLLPLLDSDDSFLRHAVLHALIQIGVSGEAVRARLRPLLDSGDEAARAEAASLLAKSGEPVDLILPKLIRFVVATYSGPSYNPSLREDLLASIASLGRAAVPDLIATLQSDNSTLQDIALLSLRRIGAAARDAVPFLIARLDAENSWDLAAAALEDIGPRASAAVPKLVELIDATLDPARSADAPTDEIPDEDDDADEPIDYDASDTQIVLLSALGGIGQKAHAAVPAVLTLADSDDLAVQHVAIQTLARIDPAHPSLPRLMRRWIAEWERASPTDGMRSRFDLEEMFGGFADAVPRLGIRARSLLPRLERLMTTAPLVSPEIRCYAAYTLARFPAHRKQAENYLKRVRKVGLSDDFEIINLADRLLERLQSGKEKSWTRLDVPHGVGP